MEGHRSGRASQTTRPMPTVALFSCLYVSIGASPPFLPLVDLLLADWWHWESRVCRLPYRRVLVALAKCRCQPAPLSVAHATGDVLKLSLLG